MEFIAIYRDPKKKKLQMLELAFVLVALPIALIWGAKSYKMWDNFRQAEALYVEGDLHLHAGRTTEAIAAMEKSLTFYPGFYSSWEALAATHHLTNNHTAELDAYKRAAAALPEKGEIHRELGTAYHEAGDHKLELVHLTKAVGILPDDIFSTRLLDRAKREADGTYPKAEKKKDAEAPHLDAGLGHDHSEEKAAPQQKPAAD